PILNVPSDIAFLLDAQPETTTEAVLIAALREATEEVKGLKQRVVELQASNILNEAYCNKLRFQLAMKEEKSKAKGQKKGKLMGDGLPRMLTSDKFHEQVVQFTEWKRKDEEG
ncbi:hypothetical protein FA15DRAFT_577952, partial [Coprinopsis marcescibilis]